MRRSVLVTCSRQLGILRAILMSLLSLTFALVVAGALSTTAPAPVCAAIAQRGTATTATTGNASLTINKPAGVVAGDVMIANIAKVGNDTTAPSATGWTLIAGADLGGQTARYGAVLYRIADGTESASFTFSLGAGTTGSAGAIVAFSGVDTSGPTPFDVAPGAISVQPNQAAVVAATTTTVSPNTAVIMFGMAANDNPTWSGWTTISPGALTELYDAQKGGPSGQASVGAAWAIKASTGATGDGAATLSNPERNGGILIALKPSASPTTLTVAPASGTYGGTCNLTATLSPALEGKTINFYINGDYKGSDNTDASGVATLTDVSLSMGADFLDAGTYTGTYNSSGVGADFAGDPKYDSSSGAADLTVNQRDLTVTATGINKVYDSTMFAEVSLSTDALGGDNVTANCMQALFADKNVGNGKDVSVSGIYITGAGAGNYNLLNTTASTTADITQRDIQVTPDSQSKTYGDADPVLTWSITSGSLAFTDNFTGALDRDPGETVGSYNITQGTLAIDDGNSGLNYNLTFASGVQLTVQVKVLTITGITIDTKLYDGTTAATADTSAAVLEGVLPGDNVTLDFSAISFNFVDRNVGNGKTVNMAGGPLLIGPDAGNYGVAEPAMAADITLRPIEITADNQTKTYGNADPAFTWTITSGSLAFTDNITGDLARNAGEDVGIYAIIQGTLVINDGNGGANYNLTFVNGQLEITQKALVIITGITADNKVYDGTTFAAVDLSGAVLNGVVGSDNVTVDSSGATANFDNRNVGSGKTVTITGLVLTGADAGNYYLVDPTTTANITARLIQITADDKAKTYGNPDPALTCAITSGSLGTGDSITGALVRDAGQTVGTYAITQGTLVISDGNSGLNYSLTFVNGELEIVPRPLTITATNRSKTYGVTVTFAGTEFTATGLVNADTVTSVTLVSTGAGAAATVAGSPYAIVPSAAVGTGLSNYTISYVNGALTVNPKALTITANDTAKTYGTAVSFAGTEFTAVGLVNADTVTGVTLTSAGAGAGAVVAGSPYPIVPSDAVGTGIGNYTISYVNGALTVNPAALTITATSTAKTYGTVITLAGTESTVAGIIGTDNVTSVTLTSAGAALAAAAGDYDIVPSDAVGTGLANYTISYVNGTLTVNPKPLTITANDRTKTYGTAVTFAGTEFSASGLVGTDSVSGVTLASSGAAASAAVGTYTIVPSAATGTGLSNYTVSYVNGTLTVTKAAASLNMTSSVTTSNKGRTVTFTVTVADTRATGTVTLMDGNTAIDTATLSNGTATVEISNLSVGSHSITAVYGGDANFSGATSSPVDVTVKGPSKGIDWWVIVAIVAIVAAGLLLLWFVLGRRRKSDQQAQK